MFSHSSLSHHTNLLTRAITLACLLILHPPFSSSSYSLHCMCVCGPHAQWQLQPIPLARWAGLQWRGKHNDNTSVSLSHTHTHSSLAAPSVCSVCSSVTLEGVCVGIRFCLGCAIRRRAGESVIFLCVSAHRSGAAAVEGLLPAGWDAIKNVQYAQCSRKAFCE